MIRYSKQADERTEAGPMECWCLHGAAGAAADWRMFAKRMASHGIGTRAVDLWRFLETGPIELPDFGKALNEEAMTEVFRGSGRILLGYSMGGRLALHSLLNEPHPWQAAVIISAHAGLESEEERAFRRAADSDWASRAFMGEWKNFMDAWEGQPVIGGVPVRDEAAGEALSARRREVAGSFVSWSLGAQQPLWQRLREIQIPVLWVAGEKDHKFLELGKRAVDHLPKGFLAVAPSGHRVPWAAGDWLAEEVSRFIKTGGSEG